MHSHAFHTISSVMYSTLICFPFLLKFLLRYVEKSLSHTLIMRSICSPYRVILNLNVCERKTYHKNIAIKFLAPFVLMREDCNLTYHPSKVLLHDDSV